MKEVLIERTETDRAMLVDFLQRFVRCRAPNLPGHTWIGGPLCRSGIRQARRCLLPASPRSRTDPHHIGELRYRPSGQAPGAERPYRRVPGGVGSGLDARPVGRRTGHGQGVRARQLRHAVRHHGLDDHFYLQEAREKLNGRLTLTVVSDEETFSPPGMLHLMEHYRDPVLGDVCLNGEPSSPYLCGSVKKGRSGCGCARRREAAAWPAFVHAQQLRSALQAAIDAICCTPGPAESDPVNEPPELSRAPTRRRRTLNGPTERGRHG